MQRLNKPAHAPLGTAFLLFVSLAIIPVSLKAAGLQVGFSPRLSAAIDIWRQIAQSFGPNYEPGSGSELAVLISSESAESAPSTAAESEACPLRQYASDREVEDSVQTLAEIPVAFVPAAAAQRILCSRALRVQPKPRRLDSDVVAMELSSKEFSSNTEAGARAIKALSAYRAEEALRVEVLKILEKCAVSGRPDLSDSVKNPGIPKSFRMLVRFKQPAAVSVTGAQCKVRTVLAPAGMFKLERASLNNSPAAPDNCDL